MTLHPDEVRAAFRSITVPVDGARGLGGHFTRLAARQPGAVAIVDRETRMTFAELDRSANRIARALCSMGAGRGDRIAIVLPNGVAFFQVVVAAWKLGAVPVPLSHRYSAREQTVLYDLAKPAIRVLADPALVDEGPGCGVIFEDLLRQAALHSNDPHPDLETRPYKIMASGGSTGTPKLVVSHERGPLHPGLAAAYGIRPGGVEVVAGPLYHNGPFAWGLLQLLVGGCLVILDRFDPHQYLTTIQEEHVTWSFVVPTMLHRVFQLPVAELRRYDLGSLEVLMLSAAPTPAWLKRRAIDVFGAATVWELYGSTELMCSMIRGDEWLAHPGSVGKPVPGFEVKVVDETGALLPVGEVGEIYVRPPKGPRFSYEGAQERLLTGGWASVGDLGCLDADGYLYISDRRTDLIITGGANVYPAEVEGVLLEHPSVGDAAVVGLPDPDWGQRVHAIVEPRDLAPPPRPEELQSFCRERLAAYKVPKSFEITPALPRDPSGKLRRGRLRDERSPAPPPG